MAFAPDDLGRQIEVSRQTLGLTLREVSVQMDVGMRTVQDWVAHTRSPRSMRHVVELWLHLARELSNRPDQEEASALRPDRLDGSMMVVRRGSKRRRSAPAVVEASPVARASVQAKPAPTEPDVLSELREIRVLLARLVEINSRAEKSRYPDLTAPRNAGQDNPTMNAQPTETQGPRKRGKPPLPGGWTPYKVGLTRATFAELGEAARRLGVKQADLARRVMEMGLRALQEEEEARAE